MPGLHIDKVGGGNPNIHIQSDYLSLMQLRNDGLLIPGQKYSFTDYLHKYFIGGSNSTGIIRSLEIYSYIYGYATFGFYIYDLPVGKEVIVTYLPEGYAGNVKVGDVTKVTVVSSNWYFQFANGMHTITGLGFKYYLQRFQTIEENALINDVNGRPVMKPNGIINIEVHDGGAYMDMTAAENRAVLPEELIVTAKTEFSFFAEAESHTYPGDKVIFDPDNTEIYNDNYELIGERNGWISRRYNEALGIDLPLDWRNGKFRRWCLDEASRIKLINQHLDVNTTRLGSDGQWLFTAANRTVAQPKFFYVAIEFEGKQMNLNENAIQTYFDYTCLAPEKAKDFTVIPFNAEGEPTNVAALKAEIFHNTVFQGYTGESTQPVNVVADTIARSTFVASPNIQTTNSEIFDVCAIDNLGLSGSYVKINEAIFLSYTQITSASNTLLERVIFATMKSGVRLPGKDQPIPVVWWIYIHPQNSKIYNTVFSGITPFYYPQNTNISESSFFTYYSPTHPNTARDGDFQREVFRIDNGVISKVGMRFLNNVDRVILSNLLFLDSNPATEHGFYLYDIKAALYSRILHKNDATQDLYYSKTDADYNTLVTVLNVDGSTTERTPGIPVEEIQP